MYCGLSGLFLALHFAFWITSLQLTSVASSTILVATQPLFTSLLAWLILKENIRARDIIALVISFLGVVIIGRGDFQIGKNGTLGDIMAIIAGAFAGSYFLAGRKVRKTLDITNYVTVCYSTAAIILGFIALLANNSFTGYSGNTFFWLFILALIPTIIGHSLFNWALKYVSTHKVGMTIFIEPIGAGVLAYFIFAEKPGISTYIGGIFILLGLYLTFTPPSVEPETAEILT
jgi:drug/metabolite transporter (DMT)-like permease